MPELDSLRGVAILLVLFYHGYSGCITSRAFMESRRRSWKRRGPEWLGVNLFSCFRVSHHRDSPAIEIEDDYYRRFYARRALRILPAYYALRFRLQENPCDEKPESTKNKFTPAIRASSLSTNAFATP